MKVWCHKQLSINVTFDRIWTLATSMGHSIERKDCTCISRCRCHTGSRPTICFFRYTIRRQISTIASWMQASSPLWARAASTLRPAHGVLTFSHAAIHAINKVLFVMSSFHSHNIIFYWNWCKAMFLFQLISVLLIGITFYTYLANVVFCVTWTLRKKFSLLF